MPPPPSENLRSRPNTFHSRSEGGFFCGLLKKISYSILSRRSSDSSPVSSSSTAMSSPIGSLGEIVRRNEIPAGHKRDGTKVQLLALGSRFLVLGTLGGGALQRISSMRNSP